MKNLARNRITIASLGRLLRSPLFRIALLSAIVLLVLFKVALPQFVSTASVKTNMENALSSWTGGRASIGGDPTISFWPRPQLTLHDVTIVSDVDNGLLLAKVDAITGDFDVLAALRGTPVFYDFRLVAPVFRIERLKDGAMNWRRSGWMSDAMHGKPDETPMLAQDVPIGDIAIENGALDIIDQKTGSAQRITDITGMVRWPTPAERIRIDLSAILKGEVVNWSFVCDEPLLFFSGRNTSIETALTASPVSFAFEGVGSLASNAFFSGQSSLSAPSISALLRWYGMDSGENPALGAISLNAALTVGRKALKLDNLALTIDGANATGVLDIALPGERLPLIGGTLAFDRLDLNSLFSALAPTPGSSAGIAGAVGTDFLEWLRLDLRLSAQQANLGPVSLTDLAAGIMVRDGRASFDVGDSTYAGGSLSGRIAISEQWINGGGQLTLSLKGADLGTIASQFNLQGPLPIGRGDVSLDLSTDTPIRAVSLGDLSGRIKVAINDGTLVNFNATAFESMVARDAFFNLSDVSNGALSFSAADLEATFENGVADLTRGDISSGDKVLSVTGRIPYRTSSLALAGAFKPADQQAGGAPLRFFVGGSWPNAVISPISVLIQP